MAVQAGFKPFTYRTEAELTAWAMRRKSGVKRTDAYLYDVLSYTLKYTKYNTALSLSTDTIHNKTLHE